MTESKFGNAIIRMHGIPDQKKVEVATQKFLQKIEQQKRLQAKRKESKQHV